MTERATRCPHCQTSFYVSHQQLESANGLVRCGACLQVFNAAEHWLEKREPIEDSGQLEFASFDETLDSDEDLLAVLKRDNASVLSSSSSTLRFTPAPAEEGTPPAPLTPEHTEHSEDIDATAPRTQETEEDTAGETEIVSSPPEDSDAQTGTGNDAGRTQLSSDKLVESIDLTPVQTIDTATESQPEEDEPLLAQEGLRAIREDLISHGGRRKPRRNGLWLLLSLLAALGLGAQYIYYYFDDLVQSPYRHWFERGCTLVHQYSGLPCELPPPARLELIRSTELVVRSHPQREGALRVDALVRNDAPFDQPFPALQLQFTNLRGEVVAARRFQPSEYLTGELKAGDFMPHQQDLRIALELLDPAPEAVNYQLLFFPAEDKTDAL